jgi:hydrogenase maturation protein HypF
MKAELKVKNIKILGRFKGVGFQPFIYKLAKLFDLSGYVKNSVDGVEIHIEGRLENIQTFLDYFKTDVPPLAYIESIK